MCLLFIHINTLAQYKRAVVIYIPIIMLALYKFAYCYIPINTLALYKFACVVKRVTVDTPEFAFVLF